MHSLDAMLTWCSSENAISPGIQPEAITFEFVPRGNHGLRAASGPTAEEGNLVQLSDGSFYAVFRTESGFLGRAMSKDGIKWQDRLHAHYDTVDYGPSMCKHRRHEIMMWFRWPSSRRILWS